ncbi:hypothetical protein Scep_030709 [Stephania cephalantha]|uniref:Uncharacterized protein n=1 Tax=Stephania cephalantha TaxID=152367 RepID=A0AAP0HDD9_9MAGN
MVEESIDINTNEGKYDNKKRQREESENTKRHMEVRIDESEMKRDMLLDVFTFPRKPNVRSHQSCGIPGVAWETQFHYKLDIGLINYSIRIENNATYLWVYVVNS